MKTGIIKTATPLAEKDIETLEARFHELLGEQVTFTVEEDESLIGGFRAYVDGVLYDMSMLSTLRSVARANRNKTPEEAAEAGSIASHIKQLLVEANDASRVYEYGTVLSSADGIVHVEGLSHSRYGELLEFENDAYGMALDLSSTGVGAVLLSDGAGVSAGSIARGTGHVLDVGVGYELLGRTLDPLGRPLDGKPLHVTMHRPIECPAPSIMDRAPVNEPLETGILSIDSMIPIGKGQRELIIGDRQLGKSTIALSALCNQSKQGVICIYTAIGQKASTIAQFIETLKAQGNWENTIVVAATASDSAAMQYIAPYAATSMAEFFMHAGRDVLIVYDDLSKHAVSYRTMSLLLKRPPGREAYPGDVFYLHSRLLERAAKLSKEKGGGSLTALPIIETMAGDISAYIPTNVISITDGQIYLESELFHAGVRPAVNVGLSVSRVGRAAQTKAMRAVSENLRLDLAQYREMSVFAQFDSDLDMTTKAMLEKGEHLTELLKQDQNTIYTLGQQVALLFAFREGLFDAITLQEIQAEKNALLTYLQERENGIMHAIDAGEDFKETEKELLRQALARYQQRN